MRHDEEDQRFCEWAVGLGFEELPDEVVRVALDLVLDFVGCALGGLGTETSQRSRSVAAPTAEGAHILGLPGLYPLPEAARQTAVAGHVLEMDDVVPSASLHPASVVVPAALAVGELAGSSGKDMVRALVIAYELMVRLGEAVDPAAHYADGFHPTATCGVFAAAAAAASLLGANATQLRTALGFAGTGASGTLSYLNDGAGTKPIQVGNAAAYGTMAALLNERGLTGPSTVFDGRYGFYQAYARHADRRRLTKGVGTEPLRILATSLKPFACCRYVQPGASLLAQLRDEDHVTATDVEHVRVGVVTPAMEIVGAPREGKVAPRSVPDAQFSLPFCAAVVLREGRLMPDDVANALGDPEVEALADRVELVADPALDAAYPDQWGAWIDVSTRDGRHLERAAPDAKGDPGNPLTRDELLAKVAALAGERTVERVEAGVHRLVDGTVTDLVRRLSEEG